MKKIIKFMSLVLIMTMMFTSMINVSAEAPNTITFTSSDQFYNYGNVIFHWKVKGDHVYNTAGSTYKTAKVGNTSVKAYCFNMELEAPAVNSTLTKRELTANEKKNEGAFVYILQNGYGLNANFGANLATKDEKYYATQIAIWALQGSLKFDNLKQSTTEQKRIYAAAKALYDESLKHNGYITPGITIAAPNNKMSITEDKKYYKSQNFTIGGQGFNTYTVAIANIPANMGAEIVVVGSNKVVKSGATLNKSDKFYVRIPTDKINSTNYNTTFDIKVAAQSSQTRLAVYKSSANKKQDVGVPITSPIPLNNSTKVQLSATGEILVRKVELKGDGTQQDLKDVTIRVTNSKGEEVLRWNTKDANPKLVNNLPLGTYTIEEISAPEGYIKSEKVNVTVTAGVTKSVTLVNTKDEKVFISKQDITTGAELPGATLVLKTITGEKIEEWVSGDTPHIIEAKLEPKMTYVLSETMAPPGYQLTTETVTFTTNANGGVDEKVVMENIPTTSVKISKVDITNQKELPGATLEVRNSKGEVVDKWVSESKPHYLPEDLTPGTYTLKETIAPPGYLLTESEIEFTITADGVEQTITMTNEPIPETSGKNVALIITGLVVTVLLAVFSIFKINKQEA